MKTLEIYPTSRSIRVKREQLKEHNGFLPTLMRIDEFEQRTILIPELIMVDSLQRVLLLKEASKFQSFQKLKVNRDLIRFFTKSDSILKFFEELSHEEVDFYDLANGDAYVEFAEHIEILEELFENYRNLLASKGLIDRAFLPHNYQINSGFIETYDRFELFLEGYMSRFELSIIEHIAKTKEFIIHMQTSKFNQKMQDRFMDMGIEELPKDSFVSFDLHTKEIIETKAIEQHINAKVFSVEERLAQIPLLFESVQEMIEQGITPEDIVVILPDEKFKNSIRLYDSFNNFNFAMGFDYNKTKLYKQLEAIYRYWQSFSEESITLLKHYNIDRDKLNSITSNQKVKVDIFFKSMEFMDLDLNREIVYKRYLYFKTVFANHEISIKEWLFLWLKQLNSLTIDDVRGGKVTIMGALETRGVSFRGVVVVDFNDGIVPSIPAKDNFLNSSLRKFANLPTKNDREALQKQIYKRILEQADKSVIIYSLSNNKSPASYLYELGLGLGKIQEPNLQLLYSELSKIVEPSDPIIEKFDMTKITWSATRLKTFLTCRRKYYYIYEQQLRPKEDDELNEGAFLHKLLENLFKEQNFFESFDDMKRAMDMLLDKLLDSKTPKINYTKLLWKAKLTKLIEQQISHFKAGWRVAQLEKQIVGEIDGVNFKGVVDRIDQDGTHTLVLDYKSGSIVEANRTKNLEKLTDFQMSIYSELLKNSYSNIELAFVELFNGKITPITQLEVKTELLRENISQLKQLNRVVCQRCEDISRCQYCDYTLLCQRGDYL
ncbi:MAG TPA: PD-(D/E)XK nuclease family protein [Campylobacterales bacterium]|nr:PD-(D/E)XK nuclease family protein [Campylobacterales bacterium]HHH51446.1 PD-(D/E)XK nuclease family protein [Campylobacterales bacterium]